MSILGRLNSRGEPVWLEGRGMLIASPEEWKREHRFPEAGVWKDPDNGKLHFLTDRLGFQHLYLYEKNGQFAWASDLSTLIALPELSLTINPEAAEAFLTCGFLPGNMTWFSEVQLLPAAAHWVLDPSSRSWAKNRYWSWQEMPDLDLSFEDAVDELAQRLQDGMKVLLEGISDQVGVSLSGGMDSRLLLALASEQTDPVAYTFGLRESWDVTIAEKVAKRAGVPHSVYELNSKNWYGHREDAIWRSAGMAGLIHLHHVPNAPEMNLLAGHNLNGYCGDALFKGFHKARTGRVTMEEARHALGRFAERYSPNEAWYGDRHSDAYWIDQHARRFTRAAVMEWDQGLRQLLPFTDFHLLKLLYGIPVEYRRNNRLYSACMLRHFPKLFKDIAWKLTGLPISWSKLTRASLAFKLPQVIRYFGLFGEYQYTRYSEWMRQPERVDRWRKLLAPSGACFRVTGKNWDEQFLQPFLARKRGGEEQLSRALTIAIWLERWDTN